MEPASLIREAGRGLLDLLFPPRCLTCDALAEPFCGRCRARIVPAGAGGALPAGLADVRSVGGHEGPLRQAVLRLKFARKTVLASELAALMARELDRVWDAWEPDFLVPVPIHWTRRWERGFNQSELLAMELARRSGPGMLTALRRIRATPALPGNSAAQRGLLVLGAIDHVPSRPVAGARVVVVDDVWTSGATLRECARALRAAGAAEVFALTVTHEARLLARPEPTGLGENP